MRDKNKYIDEFIEGKLRKSSLKGTSSDFSAHLMKRISAEHKALVEERKSDRIVKYAIGSFSFLMLGFTFLLGILSKSGRTSGSETSDVGIETIQSSNSFIGSVIYYIQKFFLDVLEFFGVSLTPGSMTIIMVVALVVLVFIAGERLFLRGKLKSSIQMK
jgi:hypothetical protein